MENDNEIWLNIRRALKSSPFKQIEKNNAFQKAVFHDFSIGFQNDFWLSINSLN